MKNKLIVTTLLATLAGSICAGPKEKTVVFAEEEIVDTKIGPGVLNEKYASGQSPDGYKLHVRNGGDWWLLLFPDNCDYSGQGKITFTDSQYSSENFKKIKIYSNENDYVTASSIISGNSEKPVFNQFADACCNIAISFKNTSLSPRTLYKVVVEEGFVYPNYLSETTCKFVQYETQSFINNFFGKNDNENFNDWAAEKILDGTEEKIPAYIGYNSQMGGTRNYSCHIRSSTMQNDGHCVLLFFFDVNLYNPEIKGVYNVGMNTKLISYYNFLDKVLLHEKDSGETLTLRKVVEGKDLVCGYNLWGENESFGIEIGNYSNPSAKDYEANAFDYIMVEQGAEFPAYATTNGESKKLIKYVQNQTIKMIDDRNDPICNDRFLLDFSIGNANIESVSVQNEVVSVNGQNETKPFVVLNLDNYDSSSSKEEGFLISENFLSRVYVNGKTLKSNNKDKTKIIHNINGSKTFGFSVEGLTVDQIDEIIIRLGCELPSANNSRDGFAIYKTGSCYVTQESVCFKKNSSNYFEKSNKVIQWCIWFGDEVVKIDNNKYFYYPDKLPDNPQKENAEFVCWTYPDGTRLDQDFRVRDSVEFIPYFIYYYNVTLNIDGSTKNVRIKDGDRLTDIDVPTKKGYAFSHWADKDGNFYNIDNTITKDITIYAVFNKINGEEEQGCNSSIIACSSIITLLSLGGITLLSRKRKEI